MLLHRDTGFFARLDSVLVYPTAVVAPVRHAVGDAVLRKVAEVMTDSIRDMDLLARYGGEEFALLASQTPLEGAVALLAE